MKKTLSVLVFGIVMISSAIAQVRNFEFINFNNPPYSMKQIETFNFTPEFGYLRTDKSKNLLILKTSLFANTSESNFGLGGTLSYAKNVLGDFTMDSANRIGARIVAGYRQPMISNMAPEPPKFLVGIYGSGMAETDVDVLGFLIDVNIPMKNMILFFKYSVEQKTEETGKDKTGTAFDAGFKMAMLWKRDMFWSINLSGSKEGSSERFDGMHHFNNDSAKFHLNFGTEFSYCIPKTKWKVGGEGKMSFTPKIFSAFAIEGFAQEYESGFMFTLTYERNRDLKYNQNVLRTGIKLTL